MPGGMSPGGEAAEESEPEGGAGFTILIEGYSPYHRISELLDPPSVKGDQSRWGFVTRLENLAKLFPGVPYKLFQKHEIAHFTVETDLVDLTSNEMPDGIGVQKEVERVARASTTPRTRTGYGEYGGGGGRPKRDIVYTEKVLIDPMTNEEISRTFDIITQEEIEANPDLTEKDLGRKKYDESTGDELYIDRDRWFRIRAKFTWKDAPKETPETPGADSGMGLGMFP